MAEKAEVVTKGKYEKNHFSSSGSNGIGRHGSIDGERGRSVFLRDPGAGGDGSGSDCVRGAGAGLCGARARGLRSARTGCL